MAASTMEQLTTCNFNLIGNTNPSHLLASDGHVYCIPIDIICVNYPIEIPLSWFLALRGDNLINFISWLFGFQATLEEWEIYQHFKWSEEKVCHRWQGVEYKYHGCK